MPDKAMDVYLNDHLAGATFGSDLAEQIRDRSAGTTLGELMVSLSPQIEEDRQTLIDLMERMDTPTSTLKQAAGWIAEKASRIKLTGQSTGEPDYGELMALESLALGIEGKASLWRARKQVANRYPPLAETDLDGLAARAAAQHGAVEAKRLEAAERALEPLDRQL